MTKRASDAAHRDRAEVFPRTRAWLLLIAATLSPAPLLAQDAPGSPQITFGIDTLLSGEKNADLSPGGTAQTIESNTRLSFGFLSETPNAFLSLDASARLRLIDRIDGDDGTGARNGLTDPNIALAFRREAVGSFLSGTAFLREADLSRSDLQLDDTIDPFLPPVGTQRSTGGSLSYRWGEDRRAGFGLTATYADTRYFDAPGQIDNRRYSLGGDVPLDLTEVMRLTLGLSQSRYDPSVGDTRDTTTLTTDLSIDSPRGPLSFSANVTDTPDGTRAGLSGGRTLELPNAILSGQIGATRGVSGDLDVTGAINYAGDLGDGRFTAGLSRSVTSGETDTETTVTRANFGYSRELTNRMSLNLDFSLSESIASVSDIATRNGTFGAVVSHELTPNWLLDAGYRMRLREVTGQTKATNGTVFLGLRRTFVTSY